MRFVVADTQGVLKLTNLINGYLRTLKIASFHKLINKLNTKYLLNVSK